MTILQSLAGYYDRMAVRGDAEPLGFTRKAIDFAVLLGSDGNVVDVLPLRVQQGNKLTGRLLDVPAEVKRTVKILPNFLWDKSAYSLGVTAGEGKRTAQEHAAFRELHLSLLDGVEDAGLAALVLFLKSWAPERFQERPFSPDMLDANIVFRLDGDVHPDGRLRFIHERERALPLIEARGGDGAPGICLATGQHGPIARLHPSIKGVDGAQTAGAALVSFNLDAFTSYGREQGANAPTGEAATFRYTAALNRLLTRGGPTRIRIGDASVAFWADAGPSEEPQAALAESWMAAWVNTIEQRPDHNPDAAKTAEIRDRLEQIAAGRPVTVEDITVDPGMRFHILGLSPNAARLSVRFWLTDTLGALAAHLHAHAQDCRVEPLPWNTPPTINHLLVETTAAQRKWDNIPPLLAGEMARAILTGASYPRTLLSAALMRLRAGDNPSRGWHAAVIRAVLQRLPREGAPMSLNREEPNPAYRLGRLFAVLEEAQEKALGTVNASITDRYFGAASATPASVFPLLLRGVKNHLSKLRKDGKDGPRRAEWLQGGIEEILDGLDSALPRSLRLEDQGRFAIGYYHQRAARFTKRDKPEHQEGDDTNA